MPWGSLPSLLPISPPAATTPPATLGTGKIPSSEPPGFSKSANTYRAPASWRPVLGWPAGGGGAAENQAAGFLTAPPSRCSEGKTGIKHGKAPLITSLPLADALASRFLNTPRVRGTAGTAGPRLRKRIPALPRPAPEPQSYAFAHLLEVYQEPTINYIFSCLLLGKTPVLLSPEQRAHSIESPRGGRI